MHTPVATRIGLAGREHDSALRALLESTSMGQRVEIAMTRDPSFIEAMWVEGERHAVAVAERGDCVVGVGTRSVRRRFVNGDSVLVGYLSQLRLHTGGSGGIRTMREGFSVLERARATDEVPFDFGAIVDDNTVARRLLTSGRIGLPIWNRVGRFETRTVTTSVRSAKTPAGIECRRAMESDLPEILQALRRNAVRFQLSPDWTSTELMEWRRRGGGPLWVAARSGDLVGVAALWDQRAYRQTRVVRYGGIARLVLPLARFVKRATGGTPLPRCGTAIPLGFLSHVSVDDDDSGVFRALLDVVRVYAARRGLRYLTGGFGAGHPLLEVLEDENGIPLASDIHIVRGVGVDSPQLDSRPYQLEAATL